MNRYVEAAVFTPRNAGHQYALNSPPDESSSAYSSQTHHHDSITMSHAHMSPPRAPRRGRTTPAGDISVNTRVKPAWSVFTSPGSFEQLYNERAYLTASLRSQGNRSMELMRRLSVLQDMIDNGLPSEERRKSRKRSTLLKSKITEAAAQEKAIWLRLSDISLELSNRERWMQVQREICEQKLCWWAMSPGFITSPLDLASVMSTPLEMVSPAFFPVGCYPVYNQMGLMSPCQESEIFQRENQYDPQWPGNEAPQTTVDTLGNHGLEFLLDGRRPPCSVSKKSEEATMVKSQLGQRRRMSLPAMRCLWPGLQDN